MNRIRQSVLAVGIAAALLGLGLTGVQAAPTLIVEAGVLKGADSVMVNGTAYDVRFVDGSCAGLYAGCNNVQDFVFTSRASAGAAATALLQTVLIDSIEGQFDSNPQQTAGCTRLRCAVLTPYQAKGRRVQVTTALNTTSRDRVSASRTSTAGDTGRNGGVSFAVWSLHQDAAPSAHLNALLSAGGSDGQSEPADGGSGDEVPGSDLGDDLGGELGGRGGAQQLRLGPAASDVPGALTDPGVVPEPGVLPLLALALAGAGLARRLTLRPQVRHGA
jgi:hypothetical protein